MAKLPISELDKIPSFTYDVDKLYQEELKNLNKTIVVLDDDPTGIQTVHGVNVYTKVDLNTLNNAFNDGNKMFFILTNSRAMSAQESMDYHQKATLNVVLAAHQTHHDYLVISRSDSTLRGHYPLETNEIRKEIKFACKNDFDGEIIMPFFLEGGRYTLNNTHYVKEGDYLVPAADTEFAKDKTFGYSSSHLGEWIEEKTNGQYKADDVIYVSLEDLRAGNFDKIESDLLSSKGFNKVVVNAISYDDVKAFCIPFIRALNKNKFFIIRSAAALTKILGGIDDKPLLTKKDLVASNDQVGGVVLVGSHTNKTSQQLEQLKQLKDLDFIEFDVSHVFDKEALTNEVNRVTQQVEADIKANKSVVVYTTRQVLDLKDKSKDEILKVSTDISDAVTSIIANLTTKPRFIIAKGGITSSDVGVKALNVSKAEVLGQVRPGIPVWLTGDDSKFSKMPYIIFPGNVGSVDDLKNIVEELI